MNPVGAAVLSKCRRRCGGARARTWDSGISISPSLERMYPTHGIVAGSLHSSGNGRLVQPIDSIDARDLPEFAAEILAIWLEKQWRFASLAEYIDAEGNDDIRAICDRYHQIPGFDMDRSYYFDWKSG
jgi:sulfite reductase (ferredoxin)